jgi:flagellar hook-associated protein 1 FlgK
MGNLAGIMSIAVGALSAQQAAMQISADNVANASTPGFTRQRPVLLEETPEFIGQMIIGRGVSLKGSQSLGDSVLELRLHQQTQRQGAFDAYVNSMSQVQVYFSDPGKGIGNAIDQFFSRLTQLSTDPGSMTLRQGVLTAAGNLAQSFRTMAQDLATMQQSLDRDVIQSVNQINQLTAQIAAVNPEVARLEKLGKDGGAFQDRRTQLIRQLSQLTGVSIINSDDGLTITTSSGAALVVADQSFSLSTAVDPVTNLTHIFANGQDITADFTGGRLGGTLAARDQGVASVSSSLDQLAYGLAGALNAAHRNGFDLFGNPGVDLFQALNSESGAAAQMQLRLTDASLLAVSSTPVTGGGDNGNLAALRAVGTTPSINGQTPSDSYANLVFQVGSMVSSAQSDQAATQSVLQQLQNERGAISGVSLDEEATNLLRYQRAFEAAARVVNIVDELIQIALQIGKN